MSREKLFDSDRLGVVGHRGAQLFNHARLKFFRKMFHPSDAAKSVPKGTPGRDNLHQVSNVLKSLSKTARSQDMIKNGKVKSLDEITIIFQGAGADVKQKCARYKGSDGLQTDAVCLDGGMLKGFCFRGHTLLPKVSIKDRPDIKISDTSSRSLWSMYLADVEPGTFLGRDNLYNSVDDSWRLEAGMTVVFEVPKGWTADVHFDGDESAKTIEWSIKGVHVLGTLRGNRGSEQAYKWPDKMSKAVEDELKARPLYPDRVKARVTADEAQVMTISILDSKGFQMVDTVHTAVELQEKARRMFDRSTGRPGYRMVPILNCQNLYNHIMGNVDLNDLMAWFYRYVDGDAPTYIPPAQPTPTPTLTLTPNPHPKPIPNLAQVKHVPRAQVLVSRLPLGAARAGRHAVPRSPHRACRQGPRDREEARRRTHLGGEPQGAAGGEEGGRESEAEPL